MKGFFLYAMLSAYSLAAAADRYDEAGDDTTHIRDIEEVVIIHSAKHTTDLHKTPTAVSLFDAAGIERQHTTSLKELSSHVPNFYMPDYGSSLTSAAYIRGVGSRINSPAVGLYVDHVGYAEKSAYDIDLLDVERIDVLRGPQSTLYGRNAMGGLIRVFTRDPMRYQGTDIKAGGSIQDGGFNASASHYHKVNHRFAFAASGFYRYAKGFYDNVTRHEDTGGGSRGGGRLRLRWKPTERLDFDLATDYTYREDRGYPYRYLGCTDGMEEPRAGSIGQIIYNDPCFYRRSLSNSSLNVRYNAPRFTLSSVTAVQFLDDNMTIDQDFTDDDYFTLSQKQRATSWSEELTLRSYGQRRWEWTSGVYAMQQQMRIQSPVSLTPRFMETVFSEANAAMEATSMSLSMQMHHPPFVADGLFKIPVTDVAAFHQSTFNGLFGTEGLSLTAGLRVEYEHMSLRHDYGGEMDFDVNVVSPMMPLRLNNLKAASLFQGHLKHDYVQWLPKVALQYSFDSHNHIYVSWSKGYRSGGYNVQMFSDLVHGDLKSRAMSAVKEATKVAFEAPQYAAMPDRVKQMIVGMIPEQAFGGNAAQTRYKPEYSYNYEAGGHFSLWNGKVEGDAAVFYMDIRDQQISKFVNSDLGRAMVNAGRGGSCGMELSLRGILWERRLSWNASYGYTHSVFKRYVAQEADKKTGTAAVDYSGNYVPFIPMHTVAAGVEYRQPVRHRIIRDVFCGVNMTGAGRILWDEENLYRQPFYALLNAHAGISLGSMVRIDIWGKNLTDTNYDTFSFTSSATRRTLRFGQSGNPLQIGVDVSLHF